MRTMIHVIGSVLALVTVATFGIQSSMANQDRRCDGAAEYLIDRSADLTKAFRYQFSKSRVFGQLLSTNNRIRSKTYYLRSQLRNGGTGITAARYVEQVDSLLCDLETLVAEARYRAARGIDPPLVGCTLHVDGTITEMRAALNGIRQTFIARAQPPRDFPYDPYRHSGYARSYGAPDWIPAGRSAARNGTGIALDRGGITFQSGNFSLRFNR